MEYKWHNLCNRVYRTQAEYVRHRSDVNVKPKSCELAKHFHGYKEYNINRDLTVYILQDNVTGLPDRWEYFEDHWITRLTRKHGIEWTQSMMITDTDNDQLNCWKIQWLRWDSNPRPSGYLSAALLTALPSLGSSARVNPYLHGKFDTCDIM